jgi:hypothetical protein
MAVVEELLRTLSSATRNMPSMREIINKSRLIPLAYSSSSLTLEASLMFPGLSMPDSSLLGTSSNAVVEGAVVAMA